MVLKTSKALNRKEINIKMRPKLTIDPDRCRLRRNSPDSPRRLLDCVGAYKGYWYTLSFYFYYQYKHQYSSWGKLPIKLSSISCFISSSWLISLLRYSLNIRSSLELSQPTLSCFILYSSVLSHPISRYKLLESRFCMIITYSSSFCWTFFSLSTV